MGAALSWPDRLIAAVDQGLRTVAAAHGAARPSPAERMLDPALTDTERRSSAALMRVNHAGEVAAQALYSGQALVARSGATRHQLDRAASEERDHLAWCSQRLGELDARPSVLDPLWYAACFCMGAGTAAFGDRVSLGFVAETEAQVEAHLKDHLQRLPAADSKSRAILERMAEDEAHHGTMATLAGAQPLPWPVRRAMAFGGGLLRRISAIL